MWKRLVCFSPSKIYAKFTGSLGYPVKEQIFLLPFQSLLPIKKKKKSLSYVAFRRTALRHKFKLVSFDLGSLCFDRFLLLFLIRSWLQSQKSRFFSVIWIHVYSPKWRSIPSPHSIPKKKKCRRNEALLNVFSLCKERESWFYLIVALVLTINLG